MIARSGTLRRLRSTATNAGTTNATAATLLPMNFLIASPDHWTYEGSERGRIEAEVIDAFDKTWG